MRNVCTPSFELLEERQLLSTALVRDIYGGTRNSVPHDMVNLNGTLLFAATDANRGTELWSSDGTEEGTVLIRDMVPGPRSSRPFSLTVAGDRVFFIATTDDTSGLSTQLWVTDGTSDGTQLVREFGTGGLPCAALENLTEVSGRLFLSHATYRPIFKGCSRPDFVSSVLWITDGTPDGTLDLGTAWNVADAAALGEMVYFAAINVETQLPQLWRSDGTPEGTGTVIELETSDRVISPQELTPAGERLFFTTGPITNRTLWVTDGTPEGTIELLSSTPFVRHLVAAGDMVLFGAHHPELGNELWLSDGTVEGTFLVADLNPGAAHSYPDGLTEINGLVCFSADHVQYGREPWCTDGTEQGTWLVQDVNPTGSSMPGQPRLLAVEGYLYFGADDGKHGRELWRSDGTWEGTSLVEDVNPGRPGGLTGGSTQPSLAAIGERVFFTGNDGVYGVELWMTDGLQPLPASGVIEALCAEAVFHSRRAPQLGRFQ